MTQPEDEIVRDGTRRIVGRAALRRASRIVHEWQTDEREKAELASKIVIALLIAVPALFAAFRYLH